ncbi:TPA: hypothetical protein ACOEAG_000246 [Enterobacter cloacae]
MIIPVTSDGKKLIESGTFNRVLSSSNDVLLTYNYDGLIVKLLITIYFDAPAGLPSLPLPNFVPTVENGEVILKQPIRYSESNGYPSGSGGMLIPYEIGVKPDGKKIYMSWGIVIGKTVGGTLVASTQYSFYEDV